MRSFPLYTRGDLLKNIKSKEEPRYAVVLQLTPKYLTLEELSRKNGKYYNGNIVTYSLEDYPARDYRRIGRFGFMRIYKNDLKVYNKSKQKEYEDNSNNT